MGKQEGWLASCFAGRRRNTLRKVQQKPMFGEEIIRHMGTLNKTATTTNRVIVSAALGSLLIIAPK
jgi:hypothetical protein